ncbi:histidine phosphatase superfamily [Stachybotrys elegans]|uniref:Histidine phosphatase superfamily n=1 Tax=Stachybotrys elegans TaxID=80388 RepID=A0A8K0SM79_9HYPO|nr:histidine phosphatase superfamily [Stachybotrys elegans]
MAPTIHLVRHAQGYHNLRVENENMHDPDLTPLGEEQCAALRKAFPHHDKVTRLVASPMRRTLYTCIKAFGEDRLYPVVALDVLQEVSDVPSDTGSPVEKIQAEFGDKLDASRVREDWIDKGPKSPFEPALHKLTERALEARIALRELAGKGDDHIVVVSHGGFLHFLTDEWYGIPTGSATGWHNCELRSYQFVDPTGQDPDAALRETAESWASREGETKPPTETEMREMRSVVQKRISPLLNVRE